MNKPINQWLVRFFHVSEKIAIVTDPFVSNSGEQAADGDRNRNNEATGAVEETTTTITMTTKTTHCAAKSPQAARQAATSVTQQDAPSFGQQTPTTPLQQTSPIPTPQDLKRLRNTHPAGRRLYTVTRARRVGIFNQWYDPLCSNPSLA